MEKQVIAITALTLVLIVIQATIGITNYYRNQLPDDPQGKIPKQNVVLLRVDVWAIFLLCQWYNDMFYFIAAIICFAVLGYLNLTVIRK